MRPQSEQFIVLVGVLEILVVELRLLIHLVSVMSGISNSTTTQQALTVPIFTLLTDKVTRCL